MVKRRRSVVSTHYTKVKRIKRNTPARKRRDTKRAQGYRSKKVALPKYGFLPDKVCCRLKATSEAFTLDPGVGGVAVVQNLKFNTPYAGFNGRQPREWDEMIALYGKCFIIGAKVTVTSLPVLTGGDVATVWGIHSLKFDEPAATYPTGLTYADITEDHRLMKGTRTCTHAYGPSKFAVMSKKWSAKKYFGVSDFIKIDSEDDHQNYSTVSTDMGGGYTAGCNVWAVNRSNLDSAAVTFNASIEYICVFTDRNAVGPST